MIFRGPLELGQCFGWWSRDRRDWEWDREVGAFYFGEEFFGVIFCGVFGLEPTTPTLHPIRPGFGNLGHGVLGGGEDPGPGEAGGGRRVPAYSRSFMDHPGWPIPPGRSPSRPAYPHLPTRRRPDQGLPGWSPLPFSRPGSFP